MNADGESNERVRGVVRNIKHWRAIQKEVEARSPLKIEPIPAPTLKRIELELHPSRQIGGFTVRFFVFLDTVSAGIGFLISIVANPTAKVSKLAHPPALLFDRLLRTLLNDRRYRQIVMPLKADMHEEYFERLARGDLWGARFVVVRCNYLTVPRWIRRGAMLAVVALLRWAFT